MTELSDKLSKLKSSDSSASSGDLYTQYTSSRVSTSLVSPDGIRINFTNYEHYTKDPRIIAYLDEQLSYGLKGITKGKQVEAKDINPMAAQKRKHIEEFLASQVGRDFSSGKLSAEQAASAVLNPTTSSEVVSK